MKKISLKQLSTLVIILAIVLAFSGCGRRSEPVAENGDNKKVATSTDKNTEGNIATSTDEIDTSDWKVYRNEEYGFELKYPKEWIVIKLPDTKAGFVLRSPNYTPLISGNVTHSGEIYLSKIKNYDNLEIIDLIDTFDDTSRFWPQKFPYKELKINGRKTIIFDHVMDGYDRKEVFIKLNNYIFSISYLYKIKDENIEKIFDILVENIKFINEVN